MDVAEPKISVESNTLRPAKFYIPSLDGFRTVAFLLVFVSHAGLGHLIPGGFGVTIFFFLSGYLITTLLRREYARSESIDFKNFYMRRILRIWPPFYLVLILAAVASYLANPEAGITFQSIGAFLAQSLHIANYYIIGFGSQGMPLGSNVYWSLAVEEHFYLIFPLLYVLLLKSGIKARKQAWVLWGICFLVLIWRCILVFSMGADSDRIAYGTDTRLDSILFGCALAVSGNPMLDKQNQVSERSLKYFLFPLGITLILCSLLYRSESFRDTLRYSIQGIALYPVFIAAIRCPDWWVFRALNWGWVRFLGILTYSLYLVHFTVIESISLSFPQLGLLTIGVLSLLITLILSYAIYQLVELPANQLKRKVTSSGLRQH
ncbi:MAG: acyltransferase [Leptolyngbya sp. SIO4C1]|nr:acyltransferase [Leptolyngbya sp. SIO4C1]